MTDTNIPKLTISSETIEQITEAFKRITEAFKQLGELLSEVGEYFRECLGNFDYTPGTIKHNTPYKPKVRFRLFDKRARVHHCRNNC